MGDGERERAGSVWDWLWGNVRRRLGDVYGFRILRRGSSKAHSLTTAHDPFSLHIIIIQNHKKTVLLTNAPKAPPTSPPLGQPPQVPPSLNLHPRPASLHQLSTATPIRSHIEDFPGGN